MLTSSLTIAGRVGGVDFRSTISRTSEAIAGCQPELGAAQAGALTTRTDNDTGIITMSSEAHTITTGQTVDLYWTVGGVQGRRYGVTVGTVAGTTVPIDGGAGDNLPAQDSSLVIAPRKTVPCAFDGDLATIFAAACVERSRIELWTVSALALGIDLAANEPYLWWAGLEATSPIAGDDIVNVIASRSGTTTSSAVEMKFGAQIDSE